MADGGIAGRPCAGSRTRRTTKSQKIQAASSVPATRYLMSGHPGKFWTPQPSCRRAVYTGGTRRARRAAQSTRGAWPHGTTLPMPRSCSPESPRDVISHAVVAHVLLPKGPVCPATCRHVCAPVPRRGPCNCREPSHFDLILLRLYNITTHGYLLISSDLKLFPGPGRKVDDRSSPSHLTGNLVSECSGPAYLLESRLHGRSETCKLS
ncbi:hypothetical protein GGR56DRAFT_619504 [Xylariaceae sp. FL0804]|nr:hypothetical protein GGR56DRAFT_619504 [Xylariaceae sp. FL0804]